MNDGYRRDSGHTPTRDRSTDSQRDRHGNSAFGNSVGRNITAPYRLNHRPEDNVVHLAPGRERIGESREPSTTEAIHRELFSHYRKG